MRITKIAAAKMDRTLVKQILTDMSTTMPELLRISADPIIVDAIGSLFQAFSNNSENLIQFFHKFDDFFKQQDMTKGPTETPTAEQTATFTTGVSSTKQSVTNN